MDLRALKGPCRTLIACLVLLCASVAVARKGPEFILRITKVELGKGVDPAVEPLARAAMDKAISARPELGTTLPEGAPDAAKNPEGLKAYLKKHKLRAFDVTLQVVDVTVEVVDAPGGKPGKVLKGHVALGLLGNNLPDGTIGLTARGEGTVLMEIGAKVRDRDKEVVRNEALETATLAALEDALLKARAARKAK